MWIRTKLFVDGIVGYSSLIFLALLYVAIGFLFFDSPQFREEELIPALKIYPNMQGRISVFAFVFLATIIFFLYRSVLLNSRSVMSYTLAALVFFLWYVEIIYFERSVAWAVSLIVAGLFGLLFILARLASQGSNDDIDDVVTPVPRKTTASNTGKSTLLS
jgi:uncharacterized membrane protein YozB (DUF420 family)